MRNREFAGVCLAMLSTVCFANPEKAETALDQRDGSAFLAAMQTSSANDLTENYLSIIHKLPDTKKELSEFWKRGTEDGQKGIDVLATLIENSREEIQIKLARLIDPVKALQLLYQADRNRRAGGAIAAHISRNKLAIQSAARNGDALAAWYLFQLANEHAPIDAERINFYQTALTAGVPEALVLRGRCAARYSCAPGAVSSFISASDEVAIQSFEKAFDGNIGQQAKVDIASSLAALQFRSKTIGSKRLAFQWACVAVELGSVAAAAGAPNAANILRQMYADGIFVQKDALRSAFWHERSLSRITP